MVFLDTYAIIEIDKGNPNYKNFTLESIAAITTLFNLIEVYFIYLKSFGEKEADRIYGDVKPMVLPIDDSIIKEAMKFKLVHQKARFSIADCIGYAAALKFKHEFLTGDYAFKGLDKVEFVV